MRSILGFLLFTFCVSSCCKKETCTTLSSLPLFFYGYSTSDLDTIYTTGYEIGSGFTQETRERKSDTFRVLDNGSAMLQVKDNISVTGNESLSDSYEWKVYIPAVNQTILLSNYDYSSYNCNKCGLRRGTPIRTLATVYVNSVKRSVGELKIYK